MASEAAIKDVIGHIAAGGSPTDEIVKAKMALIKPGLEKVTRGRRAAQGPAGEREDHRRDGRSEARQLRHGEPRHRVLMRAARQASSAWATTIASGSSARCTGMRRRAGWTRSSSTSAVEAALTRPDVRRARRRSPATCRARPRPPRWSPAAARCRSSASTSASWVVDQSVHLRRRSGRRPAPTTSGRCGRCSASASPCVLHAVSLLSQVGLIVPGQQSPAAEVDALDPVVAAALEQRDAGVDVRHPVERGQVRGREVLAEQRRRRRRSAGSPSARRTAGARSSRASSRSCTRCTRATMLVEGLRARLGVIGRRVDHPRDVAGARVVR